MASYAKTVSVGAVFVFALQVVGVASYMTVTLPGDNCDKIFKNLDGAVIDIGSHNVQPGQRSYVNQTCDVRLLTRGKWLINIEVVAIDDCGSEVDIYDLDLGTFPVKPILELTCDSEVPEEPTVTGSKALTFHYSPQQTQGVRVKVIATADMTVEGAQCGTFTCGKGYCIERSLLCDGVDHCFDSSDEGANATTLQSEIITCDGNKLGRSLFSVLLPAVLLMLVSHLF